MAGGAGSRRAIKEQIFAALGIPRRHLHFVFTHYRHLVDAPQQGKGIIQVAIAGIGGDAWELRDDRLDFGDSRKLAKLHKRYLSCEQIRILNHGTAEEQLASIVVSRQGAYRVAAESGTLCE